MNKQLAIPMGVYALYMFALAGLNFRTRIRAVRNKDVSPHYFKAFHGETPSERVIVLGRHYDNQFQLPLLFMMACLAQMTLNATSQMTTFVAWGFVASRLWHSFIHLGSNHLPRRILAFSLGWIFVCILWLQVLHFALT